MLINALTNFARKFVLSFLSTSFRQQHASVKRKLNVKSLGEYCQALSGPRKRSSNKDVGEKYDVPFCEAKFY